MTKSFLIATATLSLLGSVTAASTYSASVPTYTVTSLPNPALMTPFGLLLTLVVALVLAFLVLGTKLVPRANKRQLTRPGLALVLIGLAGTAAAQVLPSAGKDGISFGILTPFASWGIGLAGVGLLALLALGNARAKAGLDGVKNTALRNALELVRDFVYTSLASIAQTATDVLKAGAADGKLTPEEAKAALDKAVQQVWDTLPAGVRTLLSGLFGGEQGVKDKVIAPEVEAAIKNGATGSGRISSLSAYATASNTVNVGLGSNPSFNQPTVGGILAARKAAGQVPSAEAINAARARLGLPPKPSATAN